MADVVNDICRLCLAVGLDLLPLDPPSKQKLKVVIPEVNIDVPSYFMTCLECASSVQEFYKLKDASSQTEALIKNQRMNLEIVDRVKLNRLINTCFPNDNVCRLCLSTKGANYTNIENSDAHEVNSLLKTCFPDIDIFIIADPVICDTCKDTLQKADNFKTECLSVEKYVKLCCEASPDKDVGVDLHQVLNLSKGEGENDFLAGFEIQDEETDIFDSIPMDDNNDLKRPSSDPVEAVPAKMQKLGSLTATTRHSFNDNIKDELPSFLFDFNLVFNPQYSCEYSLSEWVAKVDELKVKHNWSDAMTIHKVLLRLRGQQDLYTWFSNIADIMNWNEWKAKLINAFPAQDDYYLMLKRMFSRKKRFSETYVNYYNSKLELVKSLDLTGEKAVVSILGGVMDTFVNCIGRLGQYKTPEELLEYFKSCDEKKALSNSAETTSNNSHSEQNPSLNKKPKNVWDKCSICKKNGHTWQVCWDKDTKRDNGVHKQILVNPTKQETPKPTGVSNIVCHNCGELGHRKKRCIRRAKRLADRNLKGPEQLKQNNVQTGQRPQISAGPKLPCLGCGKFGHHQNECPARGNQPRQADSQSRKARNQPRQAGNQPRQAGNQSRQAGNPPRQAGNQPRHSGNQSRQAGSKSRQVGNQSRQAGNHPRQVETNSWQVESQSGHQESYIGSYTAKQSNNNRQLCLVCYQFGHGSMNCPQYSKKIYPH